MVRSGSCLAWICLGTVAAAVLLRVPAAPAAAAGQPAVETLFEEQLIADVQADRAAAGLAALVVDPELTHVARERARFLIERQAFTHCLDLSPTCPSSDYHFAILLKQDGFPVTWAAENLAANSYPDGELAERIHAAWAGSPRHAAQISNPVYNATGMGVLCCTTMANAVGVMVGGVHIAVEIFAYEPPQARDVR